MTFTHSYVSSARYQPTPRSRVLLEKLIVPQLVKKSLAFYGTQRLINVLTNFRHLSKSWARLIQSTPSHRFLKIHSNILVPSMTRSSKLFLSLRFPHQNLLRTHPLPTPADCPVHFILLHLRFSPCNCLQCPITSPLVGPNICLSILLSNTLSLRSSPNVKDTNVTPIKQVWKLQFCIQWNLERRPESVPGDGSNFKLFDFRVKFPHKK